YKAGFHPLLQGTTTVDFGDIEQLTQAISPNTAAIILEPIQGEFKNALSDDRRGKL
ncbi:hypothetical protein IDG65_14495, partial [Staphylococcus sp. EG-SA-17]|nr:hypothetical protein [Staphylococcus sp. EG-SA-17]